MRKAGIRINDTPKIQVDKPTVSDHSIYFLDDDFRNPISLWGVFSYFLTSKPTAIVMMEPRVSTSSRQAAGVRTVIPMKQMRRICWTEKGIWLKTDVYYKS